MAHGSGERAIGYRTIYPLAGLVVVFVVYAMRQLRLAGYPRGLARYALVGMALLVVGGTAQRNAFSLVAEPQGREWALVRDAVASFPLTAGRLRPRDRFSLAEALPAAMKHPSPPPIADFSFSPVL